MAVTFSERIKLEREQQGLTVKELAEKTGLPEQTIQSIESGAMYVSLRALVDALNALDFELLIGPRESRGVRQLTKVE